MFRRRKNTRNKRTMEQLRRHYEEEKKIADRLRRSSREQRTEIMRTMYDELFAKVPEHPRLTDRQDTKSTQRYVSNQMKLLKHYLKPEYTFAEFGPGNCSLAIAVCSGVKNVYAIDISEKIDPAAKKPDNFKFIVFDGYNLDLPRESIDIAFSNQVIEHLHPDDITTHFRLVHRLLKTNGRYVFCTPQKLCGPFDISRHFSDLPQGFHLKEWTFKELAQIIKSTGFSHWQGFWYISGIRFWMPKCLILVLERLIKLLPVKVRQGYGRYILPNVTITAQK